MTRRKNHYLLATSILLLCLAGCDSEQATGPNLEPALSISPLNFSSGSPFQAEQVASGDWYTCALQEGKVYCWGGRYDSSDMGGTPYVGVSPIPIAVPGGHYFTSISAGSGHICALEADGTAYCWGRNTHGALGVENFPVYPEANHRTPVPLPVSGGLLFKDLATGLGLTCGITTTGTTHCWGAGWEGQLGNGVFEDSPIPVLVDTDQTFQSVTVGFLHSCGLTSGGLAYCWGRERHGFGNGTGGLFATPVLAGSGMTWASFEAGEGYSCGIDPFGKAFCWGRGPLAKLGLGTTGGGYSHLPLPVVGSLTFASIDPHNTNYVLGHTCGLTPSQEAYCWGENNSGELGGPSSEICGYGSYVYSCSSSPIAVQGGLSFNSVTLGRRHTCGLGTDDIVYCWGNNERGQLGNGGFDNTTVPVPVTLPTAETTISYLIWHVEKLATEGILNDGQAISLTSKLQNCLGAIEVDRPNAPKMLLAFINEVEGLVNGGVLAVHQSWELIFTAEAAIDLIGA